MERLNRIIFGILILQLYVNAAPNDVSKLDDIAKNITTTDKLESEPITEASTDNKNSTENAREKRWFNPYGIDFPPINPLTLPNYHKREEPPTGIYGIDNPLAEIHKRVQELANIARQPPPPPVPQFPIFFPVLFVPSLDCFCNDNPTTNRPERPITSTDETTAPTVTERFPQLDDERNNWGFVINENDADDREEYTRPISFEPVKTDKPLRRPPPPVEHGSVQSDTQAAPSSSQSPPTESGDSTRPQAPPQPPQTTRAPEATRAPYPPANARPPALVPPSPCEGAILTCCHQPQVVYDCFAIQGCPDFTFYGNPCTSVNILKVISKFQEYYGQRNG